MSAGDDHSIALKTDGTVWAWGANTDGQLGDSTTTDRAEPTPVPALVGVQRIAAGKGFSLALKTDGDAAGQVWAWGKNDVGQTNGAGLASVVPEIVLVGGVEIAAGGKHGAALKLDGHVWTWGGNEYGQRGNGTDDPSGPPSEARDMFAATALAAGANHSMALHPRGPIPSGVWSWGYNFGGVLGDGTTYQERTRPTETLLADATQVAGGDLHSLAVRHDGSVWAWGTNNFGQLGATGIPNTLVPREVAGLTLIPPGGLAGDPDGDGLLSSGMS